MAEEAHGVGELAASLSVSVRVVLATLRDPADKAATQELADALARIAGAVLKAASEDGFFGPLTAGERIVAEHHPLLLAHLGQLRYDLAQYRREVQGLVDTLEAKAAEGGAHAHE